MYAFLFNNQYKQLRLCIVKLCGFVLYSLENTWVKPSKSFCRLLGYLLQRKCSRCGNRTELLWRSVKTSRAMEFPARFCPSKRVGEIPWGGIPRLTPTPSSDVWAQSYTLVVTLRGQTVGLLLPNKSQKQFKVIGGHTFGLNACYL